GQGRQQPPLLTLESMGLQLLSKSVAKKLADTLAMLLHHYLLVEAKQLGLEANQNRARDWLASELDVLFQEGLLEDPPTRAWSRRAWRDWQENLAALQKLSRVRPPHKYDPAALARASSVLKGVRVVPAGGPQEVQDGDGTRVVLTTRNGKATTYP